MATKVTEQELRGSADLILVDVRFKRWNCDASKRAVLNAFAEIKDPTPTVFISTVEKLARTGRLAISSGWQNAFDTFFERHPELNVQANVELLDSLIPGTVTHAQLEQLLSYSSVYNKLAWTTRGRKDVEEAAEKAALIEELVGNLSPQIDQNGRKVVFRSRTHATPLAEEINRIENSSLEELRQMNNARLEKLRIARLDKNALHQELRKSTTRPLPPQFQEMPSVYQHPDGRVEAFSKRMFAKLDLQSQKAIVRKYGADACNKMIRETTGQ